MSTMLDASDAEDRMRAYYLFSGLAGLALGVDPGAAPYDNVGSIFGPARNQQVFAVSSNNTAGTVTATAGGYSLSLPMLLVIGAGAWLLLRK